MLISDIHTHTVYSHGKGTPEENVLAAINVGLKRVAICEHAPGHVFYGVRGEKLLRLKDEVEQLKQKYAFQIEVLFGLECDLLGFGESDIPEQGFCDVVALGFHKGFIPKDSYGVKASLQLLGIGKNPKLNAEAIVECIKKHKITFISHPSLYIPMSIEPLAIASAEYGVPLEINGSHVTMSNEDLIRAKELGASFIINSDAHRPGKVGRCDLAIDAALRAEVLDRVVNYEQ